LTGCWVAIMASSTDDPAAAQLELGRSSSTSLAYAC
jgi:hypothetical protein